jgi:hypothetical protein
MFKKIFLLFLICFLSNCGVPGSAFLGPTITGAKTGSLYQASVSYGSGKVMNSIKENVNSYIEEKKIQAKNITNKSQKIFLTKTNNLKKDLYRVKTYIKPKINLLNPLRVKILDLSKIEIEEI